MDLRDNLHHTGVAHSMMDGSPLQKEADASRFSIGGTIQSALAEIPTPIVIGAGAVAGIVARLPGEIGMAGKIATAGIGALVVGDAATRAFSSEHYGDNSSAYIKDVSTLAALTAGIVGGPRLFSSESSISKAFSRDVVEQQMIRMGPGFEGAAANSVKAGENLVGSSGREASNVFQIRDFMKGGQPGVKRVIQETEIGQFDVAKQAQIRESIDAMVKNGHKPEFLMLSKDGRVLIDREAIETAADIAAFKKP